jgi:hypothetical protein
MNSDTNYLKSARTMMIIAITFTIIAFGLSTIKDFVTERWALKKQNIACIPADVDHSFPLVYRQTAMNVTEQDALLKSFVYNYIHLTQDDQIVDYHAISNSERLKDAMLSKSRYAAIQMSLGIERGLNMKRYEESSEKYTVLKKGNMGFLFFIDDIIIQGIPQSGSVQAVIRGEVQLTYDKNKTDQRNRFWGYKQIFLTINQGIPQTNPKDDSYENKYGWYVTWSVTQELTPDEKEKLSSKSSDYYLLNELGQHDN